MASSNREAIETFMSITGVNDAFALQKLEEHGGDLNAAVNAYFSVGDGSITHGTAVTAPLDDLMDIDDPNDVTPRRNPVSLLSEARTINPFSLRDPHFIRGFFDSGSDFMNRAPFVSQPRDLREIPIEVKDGGDGSSRSDHAPVIEDITGTEHAHGPDIRGTVIVDDDDTPAEVIAPSVQQNAQNGDALDGSPLERHTESSAPNFDDLTGYNNDIEEEMIQAAIEASKQDVQEFSNPGPHQGKSHVDDAELAHVVSLSLKTAEQEKVLREQKGKVGGASHSRDSKIPEVELEKMIALNGRTENGSSSIQDEAEDVEEQPLVRHRSRRTSCGSMESAKEVAVAETSPPSSSRQNNISGHSQLNGDAFPSDEWGGISSEEHDEAVMLEAAMFGGIPEGTEYRFAYAPHQFMQSEIPYPRQMPRPPSPSLQAQRLIREQQDDEYLASLAADREKEIKAMEEAEARRLQEEVARRAALEEERQKEEESHRKLEEGQEFERQLAAKEASLPHEPASDDENAVTLLVRMPDGTRHGRRFLKSDKLQSLFSFIDVGRVVKPGTYRLVRPYPRRAFSDGESMLTLNELGLTSKQEALFLELI